jgi:hypothetical protein
MQTVCSGIPAAEGEIPSKFGASDVQDLNWVQLLKCLYLYWNADVLHLVLQTKLVKTCLLVKIMMDEID